MTAIQIKFPVTTAADIRQILDAALRQMVRDAIVRTWRSN
jgi:hypothetical protein